MYLAGADDPLGDLKAGAAAFEAKRYSAAMTALDGLGKRLPKLADYIAWFQASAQFELKNYAAVPKTLEILWQHKPASPMSARAVILAARALAASGDAQRAVELLRSRYAELPQPAGDLAMAQAFEAAGDLVSAAVYFQRVFFGSPLAAEANDASAEIAKLRTQLADNYPPAMPNAMLDRALKLLSAGQNSRAQREMEALTPQLGGGERDVAQVRIGVAQYNANQTVAAQKYLTALHVDTPEADAERLYYLLLSARRLNRLDEVTSLLETLSKEHPDSTWRMQALIGAANQFVITNQVDAYEPLFRACYESFPKAPEAAMCQWKVAWAHYIQRRSDAADLLRDHVRLYPASEQASAAMYFLGRLAERAKDPAAARAYYDEIAREYPNFYYGILARDRMTQIARVAPAASTNTFLRSVAFPTRSRTRDFQHNAAARARLERAGLLTQAGLASLAEEELRFAARVEDQPHVMAMDLAALVGKGSPGSGLRYIKRYASGYLYLPIDSAPMDFWKLAFPLPWRADIERLSKQYSIDPFLMAALIRQESEFDPKAVSVANARGLTQIEPATGRELSRKLKIAPYSTARLFQPEINLHFGVYYLKMVLDGVGGRSEAALAAYNAGLSRAKAWLKWADFQEPAEFIETVPFTQTRGYIQTVFRNADSYHRIYDANAQAAPAAGPSRASQ